MQLRDTAQSAFGLLNEMHAANDGAHPECTLRTDFCNVRAALRAALAEPEPQDVEEAWRPIWEGDDTRVWEGGGWPVTIPKTLEAAIRTDERTRWAEREEKLVEALRAIMEMSAADQIRIYALARAALGEERTTDG